MSKIRKPAVAGLFYPSDPRRLGDEISTLMSLSVEPEFSGEIFGIIVPHAGYIYSGRTAAYAFKLLKGRDIKTVIIISPSHREYFPGISVFDGDAFETPLGIVNIDKDISDRLVNGSRSIMKSQTGHSKEHAVEVEIPFLQSVLGNFSIVPIVMGDQKAVFVNELAGKLAEVYNENTLIVASSDLSHYHSRKEAAEIDSIIEQRIVDFEYDILMMDLEIQNCEACGGGPIVALMKAGAMRKYNKSMVLHRSDSGDTSGNTNEVVGYLSAVIYR